MLLKSLTLLVAVTIAYVIGIRPLPLQKFSHCTQKRFTIFPAHVYFQTERWRSYTSTVPKTCYNSSKTAGFTLQVFENSSLEVSEKSEIVATQAPELGQTVK